MKSEDFLSGISRSLGRAGDAAPPLTPDAATHLFLSAERARDRAQRVADDAAARADELMAMLERTAAEASWRVFRAQSPQDAAEYIRQTARDIEARTMLRTTQPGLDDLDIERAMFGTGIALEVMALDDAPDTPSDMTDTPDAPSGMPDDAREGRRSELRQSVIHADIGITGVDYAIAETGSCVLLPRKGISRVISLLPPVHIAVVRSGQVLPSLDELFTLRRQDFLTGDIGSYMNLISGPSRSADIEYQIVTGVHGPGEVHMILLD